MTKYTPVLNQFVNGKSLIGEGQEHEIINPFDNSVICKIKSASEQQVNEAVSKAHEIFQGSAWKKILGRERGEMLYNLSKIVKRDVEKFAYLECIDTGIPIRETRMEISTSALHFEYFAGHAGKIEGSYQDLGSRFNSVVREPYGVIGQIVPWNTPFKLMARGFAAAFACGNTMVIKPSIVAPLSILALGEALNEAGFPSGSINIVTGSGRVAGKQIVEHDLIRKIIFTGGGEGGFEILKQTAKNVTPSVLELGGKGPIIVTDNIDYEETLDGVLTQAFARKAEVCFAGTRLFLPSKLHDRFVEDLSKKANKIPMGNPLDDATQLGPLMTKKRAEDISKIVDEARNEGANIVCGGKKPMSENLAKGNFYPPTIITNIDHNSKVAREEIFGPVLAVFKYDDLNDAVTKANDSDFGLASYVWSNDIRQSYDLAQRIESGNVFINSYGYQSEIPFGGYKKSGVGREHGSEAMLEYTQSKSITVGMCRFQSRFDLD
jgi:acyl-CoA reductase-like NAD-dependent aldehyde dehydrogenase